MEIKNFIFSLSDKTNVKKIKISNKNFNALFFDMSETPTSVLLVRISVPVKIFTSFVSIIFRLANRNFGSLSIFVSFAIVVLLFTSSAILFNVPFIDEYTSGNGMVLLVKLFNVLEKDFLERLDLGDEDDL
jgi:hypothetical protein